MYTTVKARLLQTSRDCVDRLVVEYVSDGVLSLCQNKMAAFLADDIFRCIFLNENDNIVIQISLKFVPKGPIDNISALVQVMAWCLTGTKPLPETMLTKISDTIWNL